mmetsp:Transcript_10474/g.15616  ORF Transcript_10474/g.15616 Transcript_10474/m.15616 type:complete len:254 (+) Transcript_10474:46-807(+)
MMAKRRKRLACSFKESNMQFRYDTFYFASSDTGGASCVADSFIFDVESLDWDGGEFGVVSCEEDDSLRFGGGGGGRRLAVVGRGGLGRVFDDRLPSGRFGSATSPLISLITVLDVCLVFNLLRLLTISTVVSIGWENRFLEETGEAFLGLWSRLISCFLSFPTFSATREDVSSFTSFNAPFSISTGSAVSSLSTPSLTSSSSSDWSSSISSSSLTTSSSESKVSRFTAELISLRELSDGSGVNWGSPGLYYEI